MYVAKDEHGQTASTQISSTYATTFLGTANLAHWSGGGRCENALQKACLVNTLAHEWTHAIPAVGHPKDERFTDDDHAGNPDPLVSYGVGSIAHCTYLEQCKIIGPEKFWSCVEAIGTNVFNAKCNDDRWIEALKTARPFH